VAKGIQFLTKGIRFLVKGIQFLVNGIQLETKGIRFVKKGIQLARKGIRLEKKGIQFVEKCNSISLCCFYVRPLAGFCRHRRHEKGRICNYMFCIGNSFYACCCSGPFSRRFWTSAYRASPDSHCFDLPGYLPWPATP
jgi:hypothetical protein